jgi:hypothetical protein
MTDLAGQQSFEQINRHREPDDFLFGQLYKQDHGGIHFTTNEVVVDTITTSEPEPQANGTLTHSFVSMSDGTKYEALAGVPNVTGSDTAVVAIPPLGIPLGHAHIRNTFDDMMAIDFPTIAIGPPSGWRASSSPAVAANHIHQILDYMLPEMDVDDRQVFVNGGSRGAIIGLGLCVSELANTTQTTDERIVPYADLVSPCGPRPPKLKEIPEVIAYVPAVAASLATSALSKALKGNLSDFKNLISMDLSQPVNSAKFFYHVASSGISGQLAIASDPKTHMHINLFKGDKWAPEDSWHLAFLGRRNVKIDIEPGGHEKVGSDKTRRNTAARFAALREARGRNGNKLKPNDWEDIKRAHKSPEEIAHELGSIVIDRAA